MLPALLVAVLATRAGSSHAADAEGGESPPAAKLTQEWFGVELMPIGIALPDRPTNREGSVSTLHAGLGGNIRLGRHRWRYAYMIPVEAGLFVSAAGKQVIFAHVETEAGLIVPGTDRRLEIGLGLGLGVLSMEYAAGCDGPCTLGGAGWLVSLAARCLIIDQPRWTMGVNLRGVYPRQDPDGEFFGYFVGGGKMVFTGLEFGFGRSSM